MAASSDPDPSLEDKRAIVNALIQNSHEIMLKADKTYDNYIFKDAHLLYIKAIEGYMELLRMTKDDPNFQNWVK